jgi:hypothetical protein
LKCLGARIVIPYDLQDDHLVPGPTLICLILQIQIDGFEGHREDRLGANLSPPSHNLFLIMCSSTTIIIFPGRWLSQGIADKEMEKTYKAATSQSFCADIYVFTY